MQIEKNINLIENILEPYKEIIAADYLGYKNHVYRMVHFCLMLKQHNPVEREKLLIAACYHDIGIWVAKTIDYISPSIPPAMEYLEKNDLQHWQREITLMIEEHHKLRTYTNTDYPMVEIFRKGDLIDFSLGIFKFGLSKKTIKKVKTTFPNSGFHKQLMKKISLWVLKNPLNPAPMMKW